MVRPDWLVASLVNLLHEFRAKPVRDVHLALLWIAYDPATKTPGRLREDGPWWHLGERSGSVADVIPAHQLRRPTWDPTPGPPPERVRELADQARQRLRQTPQPPTFAPEEPQQ